MVRSFDAGDGWQGEPQSAKQAKAYVEKLVWNGQDAPARGRGLNGGAEDYWGEEVETTIDEERGQAPMGE